MVGHIAVQPTDQRRRRRAHPRSEWEGGDKDQDKFIAEVERLYELYVDQLCLLYDTYKEGLCFRPCGGAKDCGPGVKGAGRGHLGDDGGRIIRKTALL